MESGEGDPVVMLHGMFGKKEHWSMMGSIMADRYHVLAPDLPAHGKSLAFDGEHKQFTGMVDVLKKWLDAIHVDRVHIVGNSLGATLATIFGAVFGEHTATVGVVGAPAVHAPKLSPVMEAMLRGENYLIPKTMDEFYRKMDLLFYRAPRIPPEKLRKIGEREIALWRENTALWNEMVNVTENLPGRDFYIIENYLDKVQVPAICIWGKSDQCYDVSGADLLAQRMPNCKLVILPEIGHAVMQENFEQVEKEYRSFIERHPIR